MSLVLATSNLLESWGTSRLSLPTPATGYSVSDVYTGGPGQSFLSSGAAIIHNIDIRTNGTALGIVALFGVKSVGANVASVGFEVGTSWPIITTTPTATISLNANGDGARVVAMPGYTAIRLKVTLDAAGVLSIGQLWVGATTTISKMHTREKPSKHSNVIANVSDSRSIKTARLAAPTTDLALEFSALTQSESDGLEAVWNAAVGNFRPVVLVPDSATPTRIFYGRLADAQGWEFDPSGYRFGHVLDFVEEGRASA